MRERALIFAILLITIAAGPAFAQNIVAPVGGIGGAGSIAIGGFTVTQPANPVTVGAAAPGNCPTSPQQFEIADTTAGPLCLQVPFSAISGTATNSQLAGPLVNGVTIGAGGDFSLTKTDPLAVGNETLTPGTVSKVNGNTPGVAAVAHNFVTAIDSSARGTLAQPATTDLSDVSTGTWTPTIQGSSTAGTATYSTQYGRFIKIGPLIIADFLVSWSTFSGAAGNLQVAGLPFANASLTNNFSENHISDLHGITLTAGYTMLSLEIVPGASVALLVQDGSGQFGANIAVGGIAASGYIEGTLIYRNA